MHYIRWFVTYTTCNAIHLSNNWGRVFQKTNSSCYDPDLEDTSRGSYWKQISQFFIFLNSLFFLFFFFFIYFFIFFFFWGVGGYRKIVTEAAWPNCNNTKVRPKKQTKDTYTYLYTCMYIWKMQDNGPFFSYRLLWYQSHQALYSRKKTSACSWN